MLSHDCGQVLFAELLSSAVERFAHAVSVECRRVSREELQFPYRAIPVFKQSEYSGRGEPLKSVVVPEEKSRPMPAIREAQTPRVVVVFGKKSGRKRRPQYSRRRAARLASLISSVSYVCLGSSSSPELQNSC